MSAPGEPTTTHRAPHASDEDHRQIRRRVPGARVRRGGERKRERNNERPTTERERPRRTPFRRRAGPCWTPARRGDTTAVSTVDRRPASRPMRRGCGRGASCARRTSSTPLGPSVHGVEKYLPSHRRQTCIVIAPHGDRTPNQARSQQATQRTTGLDGRRDDRLSERCDTRGGAGRGRLLSRRVGERVLDKGALLDALLAREGLEQLARHLGARPRHRERRRARAVLRLHDLVAAELRPARERERGGRNRTRGRET